MQTLEDKIRAGMDHYAGKENVPLAPIPEEYTRPDPIADRKVITQEPEPATPQPSILELAEQQAREALIRDSIDRYQIVRDALENCLAQAQHMRDDPATAKEALKQIEMIAVAALAQA